MKAPRLWVKMSIGKDEKKNKNFCLISSYRFNFLLASVYAYLVSNKQGQKT